MKLDVNEIIEKKIQELDENHVIEIAIEEKIASVIKSAVENALSWDFTRAISDKIKEQIGTVAANIKLNSYNALVADTVRNILELELNKDLAEKVQSKVRELMLVTESTVKLSDMLKKFKDYACPGDEEYSYEVYVSDDNMYGTYKKFEFKPDNDNCKKLGITFGCFDSVWTIFSVRYDGETKYSRDNISVLKYYDPFESLLMKCLLNDIPIELDISGDECESLLCLYLD